MSDKKIQMEDSEGNKVYPQTQGDIVKIGDSNVEIKIGELEDREEIFISNEEPSKDGLWIDTSDSVEEGDDNNFAKNIKDYVDDKISPIDEEVKKKANQLDLDIVNNKVEANSAQLSEKANIVSPNFTGIPQANNKDIATTKFDDNITLLNGWNVRGDAFKPLVSRSGHVAHINCVLKVTSGTIITDATVVLNMPTAYRPTRTEQYILAVYGNNFVYEIMSDGNIRIWTNGDSTNFAVGTEIIINATYTVSEV